MPNEQAEKRDHQPKDKRFVIGSTRKRHKALDGLNECLKQF